MKRNGFTLVEIMIVVAIIGLISAIAIPTFMQARRNTQRNICLANQNQVEGAIERWAMEQGRKDADAVTWADLLNGEYIQNRVTCPAGSSETYIEANWRVGSEITCGVSGHSQ